MARCFLFLCVLVALLATPVFADQATLERKITTAQWREDLVFLHDYIVRRHPDPFFHVSRHDFEAESHALFAAIPTLDNAHIVMRFQRLLAMLGDGHTTIPLFYREATPIRSSLGFQEYPIHIEHLSDGWFVTAASQEFAALAGGRVLSLGGLSIDAIVAKAIPYISRDNAFTAFARLPYLLDSPQMLDGASILTGAEHATIVVDQRGQRISATLRPKEANEALDVSMRAADVALPLREQNLDKYFWMAPVKNGMLYVGYNAAVDMPNEMFEQFCSDLERVIATEHPKRLVIDLRRNGGGNGFLNLYLLNAVARAPKLDTPTTLFVLIGPETFSAAQMAVDNFDLRTNATFIGEPTGARPNAYGDARLIPLPQSAVPVGVSTVFHQENGAFDDRDFTPPQVFAPVSSDDERRGIDPALNALDSHVLFATFAKDAVASLDVVAFENAYMQYKAQPQNTYVSLLSTTTRFAQALLKAGKPADAARVEERALRDFPPKVLFTGDAAFGVLARSYNAERNREQTVASCKRWLAYDPYNPDAIALLRSIDTKISMTKGVP